MIVSARWITILSNRTLSYQLPVDNLPSWDALDGHGPLNLLVTARSPCRPSSDLANSARLRHDQA